MKTNNNLCNFYTRFAGFVNGMAFILLSLLCLLMVSCKSVQYIPVETVRTEYHNTVDTLRDSIFHEVIIENFVKGDTVFCNRIEYKFKDRWRIKDSIVTVIDSVQVPYMVEKKLTAWQHIKVEYFTPIAATLCTIIFVFIVFVVLKFRKF